MGVGMPAELYLQQFGSLIWDVFGEIPYLVGSSVKSKKFRDVDIRLLLDDKEWKAWGLGDSETNLLDGRWIGLCMAFSDLGRKMTGLPIDFQIQPRDWANKKFPKQPRSALGLVPGRVSLGPASIPPADRRTRGPAPPRP